jgi:hypothetical protein
MTRIRKTWAQLAAIAVIATGVLVGAGTAAKADIPPGWVPGPDSVEADFGDTVWVHQGFYPGVAGNWHTGWLNIEEDDDVLTAELVDWKCPAGAQPPSSYGQPTTCKVKRYQWVSYFQYYDVATFNQKRDRLVLRGDFPATGLNGEPAGTVNFDVYFQAVGTPTVTSNTSTGTLDYSESWSNARLVGKIDGHGLAGHGTTQLYGNTSFYVESYVPA